MEEKYCEGNTQVIIRSRLRTVVSETSDNGYVVRKRLEITFHFDRTRRCNRILWDPSIDVADNQDNYNPNGPTSTPTPNPNVPTPTPDPNVPTPTPTPGPNGPTPAPTPTPDNKNISSKLIGLSIISLIVSFLI